jgi:CRISPR-associated Csx2 family protein
MARKFMSFLGTNNYLPCTYCQNGNETDDVRFVQEALIRMHCLAWAPEDQIVVFITSEAAQKNWEDNGHTGEQCSGLHSRLIALNLSCEIRPVSIPNGRSEEELWDIFTNVCNELADNDTVILDITHALRSLPMLAMVILQYIRVLRKVHLLGIFYGAFEVLGSIGEVRKMAVSERRAPIFDLTSFAQLADWSIAVDRFLAAGDAGMIHELVKFQTVPYIKAGLNDTRHDQAIAVKQFSECLLIFTKVMSTCRGRLISKCVMNLNKALDNCRQDALIPPLVPLLEKIRERIEGFSGTNEIRDGIRAAHWCQEHNLIQQAYTILHETAVSFFLYKTESGQTSNHSLNKENREMVTGAASLLAKNKLPDEGRHPDGYEQQWKKIWHTLETTDANHMMSRLEQCRNDLNHAGIRENAKPANSFDVPLDKAIQWLEEIVKNDLKSDCHSN